MREGAPLHVKEASFICNLCSEHKKTWHFLVCVDYSEGRLARHMHCMHTASITSQGQGRMSEQVGSWIDRYKQIIAHIGKQY